MSLSLPPVDRTVHERNHYPLRIENLPDGGILATSDGVPGLVAEGRSAADTTEIAQGLARKIAESCIELATRFLRPSPIRSSPKPASTCVCLSTLP